MTNFALQDDKGSPAAFGSMPGELASLFRGPKKNRKPTESVRYNHDYLVQVSEVGTGKVLQEVVVESEAEQQECAADLGETWAAHHRNIHPVSVFSAPITETRRPHTPESLAALERVVESVTAAKSERADARAAR